MNFELPLPADNRCQVALRDELVLPAVLLSNRTQNLLIARVKESDCVDTHLAADVAALDEVNDGLVEFTVGQKVDEVGLAGEGPLEGLRRVSLALRDYAVDELERQLPLRSVALMSRRDGISTGAPEK